MLSELELKGWLDGTPPERRDVLLELLSVIRSAMPEGFQEVLTNGMLSWVVPLELCSETYNGQPLMYAALAGQKQHCSVYLMSIYMSAERRDVFQQAWRARGGRVDMGKSCLRIRKLQDAPLELISQAIASHSPEEYAAAVQEIQRGHKETKAKGAKR